MGDQLLIAGSELALSHEDAFKRARERLLHPNAPNTERAYDSVFTQWRRFCDERGLPWTPIDVAPLLTYLELLSIKRKPNTVRAHLAALASLDRASRVTAEQPDPPSLYSAVMVQRWLRSWERLVASRERVKKAPALEVGELERMLRAAADPPKGAAAAAHVLQYARDRCMLLFGVCGALRGDDLCELELGDVRLLQRGVLLSLRRGKTNQGGHQVDERLLLPQGRPLVCPVHAFEQWKRARGEAPGALFVAITRDARLELERKMSERQIQRLVKGYAQRAGLELDVTAHSLRATFATLAGRQGKPLARIMQHANWKSATTAAGYMRQGELELDNPTGGLLE